MVRSKLYQVPQSFSVSIANPLAVVIETTDYFPFNGKNIFAINVPDGFTESPIEPFPIICQVAYCFPI